MYPFQKEELPVDKSGIFQVQLLVVGLSEDINGDGYDVGDGCTLDG